MKYKGNIEVEGQVTLNEQSLSESCLKNMKFACIKFEKFEFEGDLSYDIDYVDICIIGPVEILGTKEDFETSISSLTNFSDFHKLGFFLFTTNKLPLIKYYSSAHIGGTVNAQSSFDFAIVLNAGETDTYIVSMGLDFGLGTIITNLLSSEDTTITYTLMDYLGNPVEE